jgi:hypothetical protein
MFQQFAADCNEASIVGNDNVNDEIFLGEIKIAVAEGICYRTGEPTKAASCVPTE